MLDQEDDQDLDDEWLTAYDQLTIYSKAREKILGRVKLSELISVQGHQSSEEDLVVRERAPTRTERLSVREPGAYWNHSPISQANNNSSSGSQEIPVSIDNEHPEATKDQVDASPSGEYFGRNVHVRRS